MSGNAFILQDGFTGYEILGQILFFPYFEYVILCLLTSQLSIILLFYMRQTIFLLLSRFSQVRLKYLGVVLLVYPRFYWSSWICRLIFCWGQILVSFSYYFPKLYMPSPSPDSRHACWRLRAAWQSAAWSWPWDVAFSFRSINFFFFYDSI